MAWASLGEYRYGETGRKAPRWLAACRPVAAGGGGRWGARKQRARPVFTPLPFRRMPDDGSSDLADQVERGLDGLVAFLPLGRAHLVRVRGDVLCGLELAQRLGHVTRDGVVVDFHGLDDAFRVDDEGAAQRQ